MAEETKTEEKNIYPIIQLERCLQADSEKLERYNEMKESHAENKKVLENIDKSIAMTNEKIRQTKLGIDILKRSTRWNKN